RFVGAARASAARRQPDRLRVSQFVFGHHDHPKPEGHRGLTIEEIRALTHELAHVARIEAYDLRTAAVLLLELLDEPPKVPEHVSPLVFPRRRTLQNPCPATTRFSGAVPGRRIGRAALGRTLPLAADAVPAYRECRNSLSRVSLRGTCCRRF